MLWLYLRSNEVYNYVSATALIVLRDESAPFYPLINVFLVTYFCSSSPTGCISIFPYNTSCNYSQNENENETKRKVKIHSGSCLFSSSFLPFITIFLNAVPFSLKNYICLKSFFIKISFNGRRDGQSFTQ